MSSNDKGILMYYKANTPSAPNDPSAAAPGQLTEWTIRDKPFLTTVNAYDREPGVRHNPRQRADDSGQLRCVVCRRHDGADCHERYRRARSDPVYSKWNGRHARWNNDNSRCSAPADALLELLTNDISLYD